MTQNELIKILMKVRANLITIHRQISILEGYTEPQKITEWTIDSIDQAIQDYAKLEYNKENSPEHRP